jgi:membrane fusion protein, multidrug efflux system
MSATVRDREKTDARNDGGGASARQAPPQEQAGAPSQAPSVSGKSPYGSPTETRAERERTVGERLRRPLMIGVPLLAITAGLYLYLTGGRYQSTDDAYVRAAQVAVSTNVSGRVSEVDVRDNQSVHRGETLFRLDQRPFRIAVDAARARLASSRLHVEALKADYGQRLAELKSAESALAYERREYERQMRLLRSGITSQARAERALLARNEAEQTVSSDKDAITSALADLGGDPNLPVDQHPGVEQARAALNRALLDLSYTVIKAPLDGIVTRVDQVQVGDYIKSATPVFALVSTHEVWIRANFKEVQLTHMRVGQSAKIWIDAYPERTFAGRVASLSPGTGADFSLLPAENATGNWVKVVQRLPVRIALEGRLPADLPAGLSATVDVDTRWQRTLFGSAAAPSAEASGGAGK